MQSMALPDYITSIAFSPDGKRLAAASVGYGVTIWEQQP
jgi:hypothetical protein